MSRAGGRTTGETFYEAQRRHRRSGWRFTELGVLGVVVTTLPVALVLSPPFTALVLVVVDLLRLALPLPDLVADVADLFLHIVPDLDEEPSQSLTLGLVLTVAGLTLLPGLAIVLVAWLLVQRLFRRAGPEAVVLATGAREPRTDDPEERQLVNLVEETAIAAGIPAPRVRLLDHEVVNAAIVGRSVDDATVVVPRALLQQLDRRATGALIADLVATAVNGDLRTAQSIAATAQTNDVLNAVLAAPTSRRARRVLRSLWTLARRSRSARSTPGSGPDVEAGHWEDARFIVDELVAFGQLEDMDDGRDPERVTLGQVLTLPLLIARAALLLMNWC